MRSLACLLAVLVVACGAATAPAHTPAEREAERAAIVAVLDDFHDAAASSDEARYFAHFTTDGVFLGTDATERWDATSFRAYAHPHFAADRGWVMRATRRDVVVRTTTAWFDEDLETRNLGPARGSGVLERGADGVWRIAQYNLAITVPNERFDAVRALLAAPAPAVIDGHP